MGQKVQKLVVFCPSGIENLPEHELGVVPVLVPVQVVGLVRVDKQIVQLAPAHGTVPVWLLSLLVWLLEANIL